MLIKDQNIRIRVGPLDQYLKKKISYLHNVDVVHQLLFSTTKNRMSMGSTNMILEMYVSVWRGEREGSVEGKIRNTCLKISIGDYKEPHTLI